jgi:hypothetical protein
MQEIAPNVFMTTNSLGLITGIIHPEEGLVLIDSPTRLDDIESIGSKSSGNATPSPRFLVILDTNYDRLLSAKGMDFIHIGHANSLSPTKLKSGVAKASEDQTSPGDTPDTPNSSMRQFSPEIVFQTDLSIFLGTMEIRLEHHAGVNNTGVWVELPQQKVIFVGDAVMGDEPPFLAYFDADAWLEDLGLLTSERFQGYQIISSRCGIITQEQIDAMRESLTFIRDTLDPLLESKASLDELLQVIPQIIEHYKVPPLLHDLYFNRLRWGLTTYYENHR